MTGVVRFCCRFLIVFLQALLFVWVACAPLVWILRDGLGPDSHESGWGLGLLKFAMQWGIPALALAVPLYGLSRAERRLARPATPATSGAPVDFHKIESRSLKE
jgi:hypothetical protein